MNNLQRSGDHTPNSINSRIRQLEQDEQYLRNLAPPMTPPRNHHLAHQLSMASQTTPSLGRQENNFGVGANSYSFLPPNNPNSQNSHYSQSPGPPPLFGPYPPSARSVYSSSNQSNLRNDSPFNGSQTRNITNLTNYSTPPPSNMNNMIVSRPPTPHPNFNWANNSIIGRMNHQNLNTSLNISPNQDRGNIIGSSSQGQELQLTSGRRQQPGMNMSQSSMNNNESQLSIRTPMGQLYNSNGTALLLYDTENSRSPASSGSTESYCQCESCRRFVNVPNRARPSPRSFTSTSSSSSSSSGGIHVIMVCRRHCPYCTPRGRNNI